MQKNKKQNCRIAAKVCLYMYPLSLLLCCFFRYGKKLLFLKKVLPLDLLHASGWPHFFHYLLLRPSSFLGCLHFFSQQNSLKVICKKKNSCKNKLPARNKIFEGYPLTLGRSETDLLPTSVVTYFAETGTQPTSVVPPFAGTEALPTSVAH